METGSEKLERQKDMPALLVLQSKQSYGEQNCLQNGVRGYFTIQQMPEISNKKTNYE